MHAVVMASDLHDEKLFVDLVSSLLRDRMDSDWEGTGFELPDSTLSRVAVLENMIDVLRMDVASIKSNVELLVNALESRSSQAHLQQCVLPFVAPSSTPPPPTTFGHASLSLSPGSSPASPVGSGYAFRCPICTKPQYTPKSHCGHIRKLADGSSYCSLRADVAFHAGILRCHGSVSQFIAWYTRRLRSSVGSHYTDADICDYLATQEQLKHDVATGVMYAV